MNERIFCVQATIMKKIRGLFLSTIVTSITVGNGGGTNIATTTRYWDCNGGACGCGYRSSNGEPAHCYSNAMFAAPDGNPYGASFYGTAAVSAALGGGMWIGEGCGKCYKVTGAGNIPGYNEGVETTLVLKATNFCPGWSNPVCDNGNAHFDIAAPGFDFLGASASANCPALEPGEAAGFGSCGQWMIASDNPAQNCDCDLFINPILRTGCENFLGLYWNNVQVTYEEVTCPEELSRLNCWQENGNNWPIGIPEYCASNIAEGPTFPTTVPPTGTDPSPTNPSPTNPPPPPMNSAKCIIEVQDANPYWACLLVGFDTTTVTLDFSVTGIDLSQVKLDQGVFASADISGQLITLENPSWVSLTNKGYLGFHGENVVALANLLAPACINI